MLISQRIGAARPLATTAMHERAEALQARGQDLLDFSIAISPFAPPAAVRTRVAEALARPLPYTAVGGDAAVRAHLAAHVREEHGIDVADQEVIVTNGAKQALYEALYVLTDPGDSVIVLRPHWPAYVATATLLNLKVLAVDLPARMDAAFFDSLPSAKLILLNNPHNPTGRVCSRDELLLLADWMKRRHCHAIVDECYDKLVFDGVHTSLAACCDWRALGIVTLYSASQNYAMMGWRCGFALAPTHVVQAMETLQGPITAAPSALTQIALDAAMASGDPAEMRAHYRQRRDLALRLAARTDWLRMQAPAAGPYLWADIGKLGCSSAAFAERLLTERQVAVMPGEALGVPGHIRLGYISGDESMLRRGIEAIIALGEAIRRGA